MWQNFFNMLCMCARARSSVCASRRRVLPLFVARTAHGHSRPIEPLGDGGADNNATSCVLYLRRGPRANKLLGSNFVRRTKPRALVGGCECWP